MFLIHHPHINQDFVLQSHVGLNLTHFSFQQTHLWIKSVWSSLFLSLCLSVLLTESRNSLICWGQLKSEISSMGAASLSLSVRARFDLESPDCRCEQGPVWLVLIVHVTVSRKQTPCRPFRSRHNDLDLLKLFIKKHASHLFTKGQISFKNKAAAFFKAMLITRA